MHGSISRHVDPRTAALAGKLSFRGDMDLGVKLGNWIRKAVEQGAAAAGALENAELEVAETDRWEKFEDADECTACRQQGFKVSYMMLLL